MSEILGGLKHTLYIYAHPFDGFWTMKSEKKGNLKTAFVILFLLVVTSVYRGAMSGYIFSRGVSGSVSVVLLTLGILAVVALYCVSNWALTTLLDGNGNIRYVFIALMYSVTPVVIMNIPITVLSNLFVLDEAAFLSFLSFFSVFWMLCLILIGNYSIHEYTMIKSIATFIGTILVMTALAILVILFFNLLQQVYVWITSVIKEIMFRF